MISHKNIPFCKLINFSQFFFPGNIRRFRRICEHAQSVVSVVRRPQQQPPSSPRAARRTYTAVTSTTTTTATTSLTAATAADAKDNNSLSVPSSTANTVDLISDSSSCNSDLSERIQYIPIPGPGSAEKSNLSVGERGAIRHQVTFEMYFCHYIFILKQILNIFLSILNKNWMGKSDFFV